MNLKKIASRIQGISTPFGGVSWRASESERDSVRSLITFLEDRRVLYRDFQFEIPDEVTRSIQEIRKELTRSLQKLEEDSKASPALKAMRAACRDFLSNERPHVRVYGTGILDQQFPGGAGWLVALGELRAIFGMHLGVLAAAYKIEIEDDLASILPPSIDE